MTAADRERQRLAKARRDRDYRARRKSADAAAFQRRQVAATAPRTTYDESMALAAARRAARTPEQVAADKIREDAEMACLQREAERGQAR